MCEHGLVHNDYYIHYDNLFFIIIEDSGVEVIDYDRHQWFQVVSPAAFKSVELIKI